MPYENIVLENRQRVQILFIHRPQVLNALNEKTLLEIEAAVQSFADDDRLSVLIVTGSGDRAFAAGADIQSQYPLNAEGGRKWGLLGHRVMQFIENLEKPVIAAINGFALGGGCELAMACDIRLASEKAQLGQPEVTLGITPGYGGTQRLTQLVGAGKAKQLVLSGQRITAAEAHRIGLVDEVYPAEALLEEAVRLAEKIAANAPLAVHYAKLQINQSLQINTHMATTVETGLFGICFATGDQKEGMQAFLEKRKPMFAGK